MLNSWWQVSHFTYRHFRCILKWREMFCKFSIKLVLCPSFLITHTHTEREREREREREKERAREIYQSSIIAYLKVRFFLLCLPFQIIDWIINITSQSRVCVYVCVCMCVCVIITSYFVRNGPIKPMIIPS